MKSVGVAVSCVILLVSCVTTKAVRLGNSTAVQRPAVPWNNVAVYRSADQVPGKYEEVALLAATGESMWTSEAGMWKSLQKKAGAMGACLGFPSLMTSRMMQF